MLGMSTWVALPCALTVRAQPLPRPCATRQRSVRPVRQQGATQHRNRCVYDGCPESTPLCTVKTRGMKGWILSGQPWNIFFCLIGRSTVTPLCRRRLGHGDGNVSGTRGWWRGTEDGDEFWFAEIDGWAAFPKSGTTGRGRGKWGGGHVRSVPGKFNFRGPKETSGEQPVKRSQRSGLRRELWTF